MALLVGALAAGTASYAGLVVAALVGVAVAGGTIVALGLLVLWPMDAESTLVHVGTEDVSPPLREALIIGLPLVGLGGIVILLVGAETSAGSWSAAVALAGVFSSWCALHQMYATRYAHLFYAGEHQGGITFDDSNLQYQPRFSDFLYFSYNLGMTYQVSDTAVTDVHIRQVVLRHCLLSYVFGTAILATTINLVVGALTS